MIMPSFTTLPESMLGGQAVAQKFQSSALAGLRGLGMRGITNYDCLPGRGIEWPRVRVLGQYLR